MKRINKADITKINEFLNTLRASEYMLTEGDNEYGKAFWANKGYKAMIALKEYGIFAGAGSESFWTANKQQYVIEEV